MHERQDGDDESQGDDENGEGDVVRHLDEHGHPPGRLVTAEGEVGAGEADTGRHDADDDEEERQKVAVVALDETRVRVDIEHDVQRDDDQRQRDEGAEEVHRRQNEADADAVLLRQVDPDDVHGGGRLNRRRWPDRTARSAI